MHMVCTLLHFVMAEYQLILPISPQAYHQISSIRLTKSQNLKVFLVSSCSCLCPIHWSQVLRREWRCSWSSAYRRCSNDIWVIKNFIAYLGANYIKRFKGTSQALERSCDRSTQRIMGKFIIPIHNGCHNNTTRQYKTVCTFYGIYHTFDTQHIAKQIILQDEWIIGRFKKMYGIRPMKYSL